APRQRPSLHPPSRAQPTPETNSKLDRNWGQGHCDQNGQVNMGDLGAFRRLEQAFKGDGAGGDIDDPCLCARKKQG
ncbi:hypothetical protein, partial [Mesorhizobium robiniae]|uniref:hypothetical protein n=1 Tax=Mesorhizobium robiniae TaxID=559315 RepID=UPI0033940017